jgi:hypothetical protein
VWNLLIVFACVILVAVIVAGVLMVRRSRR